MRGRHARVRRMELIGPAAAAELGRDLIDPLGDDQYGAVHRFREEVAQRPLEAARQHYSVALLSDERERAVNLEDAVGIGSEQSAASRSKITGPEVLRAVRYQVDHLRDRFHGSFPAGRMRIAWPPPGASAIRRCEVRVTVRCDMTTGVGFVSQLAPGPSA